MGVDWFFWLVAVLLGGGIYAQTPEDWKRVAIWTAVVFVSIIVHELGHAFAGRRFGANPAIKLHGFGGLTFLHGARFKRNESIVVSAAGPLAGFALGGIFLLLQWISATQNPSIRTAIGFGLFVNFFWTCVNLLPIQPLDGGQILREALGPQRIQMTRSIGFVAAAALCVWAFSMGLIVAAIMMGLLAYYNFSSRPVEGGVVKD